MNKFIISMLLGSLVTFVIASEKNCPQILNSEQIHYLYSHHTDLNPNMPIDSEWLDIGYASLRNFTYIDNFYNSQEYVKNSFQLMENNIELGDKLLCRYDYESGNFNYSHFIEIKYEK